MVVDRSKFYTAEGDSCSMDEQKGDLHSTDEQQCVVTDTFYPSLPQQHSDNANRASISTIPLFYSSKLPITRSFEAVLYWAWITPVELVGTVSPVPLCSKTTQTQCWIQGQEQNKTMFKSTRMHNCKYSFFAVLLRMLRVLSNNTNILHAHTTVNIAPSSSLLTVICGLSILYSNRNEYSQQQQQSQKRCVPSVTHDCLRTGGQQFYWGCLEFSLTIRIYMHTLQ